MKPLFFYLVASFLISWFLFQCVYYSIIVKNMCVCVCGVTQKNLYGLNGDGSSGTYNDYNQNWQPYLNKYFSRSVRVHPPPLERENSCSFYYKDFLLPFCLPFSPDLMLETFQSLGIFFWKNKIQEGGGKTVINCRLTKMSAGLFLFLKNISTT